jgi:CRP/FNR family transcriptional regulator
MKRADFIRLIQIEPQLALDLMSVLAERLRLFNHIIAGLAFKEAPLRLAGFLYQCITDKFDRVAEVRLPFTKSELAKILGMTPETLSRGFSRLKAEGFITISGRKITILDPSGLAKMIE